MLYSVCLYWKQHPVENSDFNYFFFVTFNLSLAVQGSKKCREHVRLE